MSSWKKPMASLSVIAAMTMGALAATAGPAAASTDDGFMVYAGYSDCPDQNVASMGTAEYIDYGKGAAGGGNNDDYIEISDLCSDRHGIQAWAWLNGTSLGTRYNGNGVGKTVVWDPFPGGNVAPKQNVGLKVCIVDGINGNPSRCEENTVQSVDG
jgi:hypothetical protein